MSAAANNKVVAYPTSAVPFVYPEDWRPADVSDLVGPAAAICAAHLAKVGRLLERDRGRVKLLLYGEPGCGKSEIARLMTERLAASEHNRETIPGRCLGFERASEWLRTIHQESFYGRWQVRVVEEVDTVRRDAQDVLLQVLDDLPARRALIATSNLEMGDLHERFQTRWQVVRVDRPSAAEVAAMILRRWPMVPAAVADEVAAGCGGNVRAAMLDLQNWFDAEWDGGDEL